MTIEKLSEYYKLEKYIRALREELMVTRARAYGVSGLRSDGGCGGHGGNSCDLTGKNAVDITTREEELKALCRECEAVRERIFCYITREVAKEDPLIAGMMYWRFIARLSWAGVGMKTGNSAKNCLAMVKRYLERQADVSNRKTT